MRYCFEILPRSTKVGGGWQLRLLEDGHEVGGGVFPVQPEDPQAGVGWWNGLNEQQRAHWLKVAKVGSAAGARYAWREAQAYMDAEDTGRDWVDSKGGN